MSKIRQKLSRKLSLAIILMAIPIFVLSLGLFIWQARYLISQEAIERTNSLLNMTMLRVRNYMSTIETSTNTYVWLLEENFTPDSLEAVSHRIVKRNPNIISCSVSAEPYMFPQSGRYFSVYTKNEGDTIFSVRETEFDYFGKALYREPVYTGKACWVDPFSDYTETAIDPNEAIASYCRPLYLRNKEKGVSTIAGVIATDLSFRHLSNTIGDIELPYPHAYFMLLGDNGRFFIHPDSMSLFRKTIFNDADPSKNADIIALGHEMTGGKQGTMHVEMGGRLCHVCYSPVTGTNWSLALVCPESEILSSFNHLGYIIIAVIIIGLLLIMWLCNRVVRQTIRPLHKLLDSSRQIADGNYDTVIPRSNRNDVIGQLQNSFSAMQQSLQKYMGSMQHATDKLSQRTEEQVEDMKATEIAVKRKSTLVQNVMHQIRTPLNIILGFTEVLYSHLKIRFNSTAGQTLIPESELNKITGIMKHNTYHLNRMVLMLYDSSEAGAADTSVYQRTDEVYCNALARECIDHTQSHFPGSEVSFVTDLPEGEQILTNYLYLMRSLRELIYNAAKYSDGKHVVVHVSQTENSVCFTVEDTGPGLPEESQDLQYDLFTKLDEDSEGLGLGLPLTHRHVQNLGGKMVFDKDYHKGCRVTIEMPK